MSNPDKPVAPSKPIATAMSDRELLRDHELRGLIRPYPTRPTSIAGVPQSSSAAWEPVTHMLYTPHKNGPPTLHMCEAEDAGAFLVYRANRAAPAPQIGTEPTETFVSAVFRIAKRYPTIANAVPILHELYPFARDILSLAGQRKGGDTLSQAALIDDRNAPRDHGGIVSSASADAARAQRAAEGNA